MVANTWYVGTTELSSVLVTGPKGHILIDGALPQSVAQIEANIKALGFRLKDIKVIVNSHPHFDHAGGIAQLARDSGAVVMASAAGASVLKAGVIGSDDPQYEAGGNTHFPRVGKVSVLGDGEVIALGPLKLTAHMTPGHTAGGASYTWQSCSGKTCVDVAYLDSLNPAASEGFYYSGDASKPDIVPGFEASIAKVAAFKCDVVLSAHPDFTDMLEKLAARTRPEDVAEIAALFADDALGGHGDTTDPQALPDYLAAFARIAASPNETLYVAEKHGDVVGTFQTMVTTTMTARGSSSMISKRSRHGAIAAGRGSVRPSRCRRARPRRAHGLVQLTSNAAPQMPTASTRGSDLRRAIWASS